MSLIFATRRSLLQAKGTINLINILYYKLLHLYFLYFQALRTNSSQSVTKMENLVPLFQSLVLGRQHIIVLLELFHLFIQLGKYLALNGRDSRYIICYIRAA